MKWASKGPKNAGNKCFAGDRVAGQQASGFPERLAKAIPHSSVEQVLACAVLFVITSQPLDLRRSPSKVAVGFDAGQ